MKKYTKYIKQILKVALPMIVAHLGNQITTMADTIMVGNVSSLHLGAAAIANYLFQVPFLFGIGLAVAITPLIGNANGAGDLQECKNIFVDSFYYQLFNAVFLTLFIYLFGFIIPFIKLDAGTAELAIPYYNWIAFSFFPLAFTFWIKQYFDGFQFTIYGMLAVLVGNVVNVLFNWLLIYGKFGFPELKLTGAGIATFISRVVSMLLIFGLAAAIPKLRKLIKKTSLAGFSFARIKNLYKIGVSTGLQSSLEMSAFSFTGIMAGWIGTVALASYQITMNIIGFAYMAIIGLGSATTVIVSTYVGEKNAKDVLIGSRSMLYLAFAVTSFFSIIMILTRNFLPQFYGNDVAVLSIVPILLIYSAAFHISDGLCFTLVGILRGLLDVRVPTIIQTSVYWFLMVPFCYIFAFILNFGVEGIFYGIIIGLIICGTILFFRYKFAIRKQIRQILYDVSS